MIYIKKYYDSVILLLVLWFVLNEGLSLQLTLTGLLFSLITLLMVHMLFSNNDHVKNYRIQPRLFLWYVAVLLFHILKSGIHVAGHILKGNCSPQVVKVRTKVRNHWYQCLIANSITLTPGTVTIDKTDHDMTILWLCPTTSDPEAMAEAIFGPFERILLKGDYR